MPYSCWVCQIEGSTSDLAKSSLMGVKDKKAQVIWRCQILKCFKNHLGKKRRNKEGKRTSIYKSVLYIYILEYFCKHDPAKFHIDLCLGCERQSHSWNIPPRRESHTWATDEITCLGNMPSPNVGGPLSVIRVLDVQGINIKTEACDLQGGMIWFATWSRIAGEQAKMCEFLLTANADITKKYSNAPSFILVTLTIGTYENMKRRIALSLAHNKDSKPWTLSCGQSLFFPSLVCKNSFNMKEW